MSGQSGSSTVRALRRKGAARVNMPSEGAAARSDRSRPLLPAALRGRSRRYRFGSRRGGYACALQRHKDGFTGGSIHRDGAAVRYDRQRVALSRRSRIGRGMYLTGNLLMIALRRNTTGSQTIGAGCGTLPAVRTDNRLLRQRQCSLEYPPP